jgi:hypothetical protein
VISVGALALALGGGISVLTGTTTAEAAVLPSDCGVGDGALAQIGAGVCGVVGGVVDLTTSVTTGITGTLDTTGGTQDETTGGTSNDQASGSGSGESSGGLGDAVDDVTGGISRTTETPATKPTASSAACPETATCDRVTRKSRTTTHRRSDARPPSSHRSSPDGGGPTATPSIGVTRTRPVPTPTGNERKTGPGKGRLSSLWPDPPLPALAGDLRARPIRPARVMAHKSDDDVIGTSLTMALLLSAILATRVVSARRGRIDRRETIPLQPAIGVGQGRHRVA